MTYRFVLEMEFPRLPSPQGRKELVEALAEFTSSAAVTVLGGKVTKKELKEQP